MNNSSLVYEEFESHMSNSSLIPVRSNSEIRLEFGFEFGIHVSPEIIDKPARIIESGSNYSIRLEL